jgi:hypothetical protein
MCAHAHAVPAMPSGPLLPERANAAGSELSRQVPVDLEPDADLNEGRGAPSHWSSSLAFPSSNKVDRATPPHKPRQPPYTQFTQQGNSIAGPVGLPVTTQAAYHRAGQSTFDARQRPSRQSMNLGSEGVLSH